MPVSADDPGLFPAAAATGDRENDSARLEALAEERAFAEESGYRIGPGDLLEIRVFAVDEMNRTVRVGKSGTIQLPLIGTVPAAGEEPASLAAEIARRLRTYVKDPQVDVFVQQATSQQVAVTGAVARPGLYPLTRERYTLLDALAEAGGLTEKAGGVVELVPALPGAAGRGGLALAAAGGAPEARRAIRIDLKELLNGSNRAALNLAVVPGDVIYVPEAGSFTIEGWVDKPGTYVLTRETTVLAALSAGGGPLLPAQLGAVEILRPRSGGEREVITVDLDAVRAGRVPDVPLRPGDIVRVPASAALVVPWSIYSVMQGLVRIGASVPLL
jgi:polysaccharide export outer membrane protein